ncbi:MAG: hypothetical protein PHQ27_02900 [Victivallales bacterium]|nr:hypothetical protein [Victivallales bacterium]
MKFEPGIVGGAIWRRRYRAMTTASAIAGRWGGALRHRYQRSPDPETEMIPCLRTA